MPSSPKYDFIVVRGDEWSKLDNLHEYEWMIWCGEKDSSFTTLYHSGMGERKIHTTYGWMNANHGECGGCRKKAPEHIIRMQEDMSAILS